MTSKEDKEFSMKDSRSLDRETVKAATLLIDQLNAVLATANPKVDLGMGVGCLLEVMHLGMRRIYVDMPYEEYFEFLKTICTDWANQKLKQTLDTGILELKCSLCDKSNYYNIQDTKANIPFFNLPKECVKIVTEGCPSCWTGKGPMMHNSVHYNKDGKIITIVDAGNKNEFSRLFDTLLGPTFQKRYEERKKREEGTGG